MQKAFSVVNFLLASVHRFLLHFRRLGETKGYGAWMYLSHGWDEFKKASETLTRHVIHIKTNLNEATDNLISILRKLQYTFFTRDSLPFSQKTTVCVRGRSFYDAVSI
jgi:hypothetical protein